MDGAKKGERSSRSIPFVCFQIRLLLIAPNCKCNIFFFNPLSESMGGLNVCGPTRRHCPTSCDISIQEQHLILLALYELSCCVINTAGLPNKRDGRWTCRCRQSAHGRGQQVLAGLRGDSGLGATLLTAEVGHICSSGMIPSGQSTRPRRHTILPRVG